MLASAYAQLGQLEEARAQIAEVLRLDPNLTLAKGSEFPPARIHAIPSMLSTGCARQACRSFKHLGYEV
jgi:hypothetical protein